MSWRRKKQQAPVGEPLSPAGPKPGRRGRWRRRLRRLFFLGLILALALRFGGPYALPTILDRALALVGLEGRYEELDLHVLDGRVMIRGLEVGPRAAEGEATPDRLVELTYAHFDLDVSELFHGRLRVNRAELDGLDVRLARDEGGKWNFLECLPASLFEPSAEAPAPEPADEDETLNLRLPVEIDFLAAQNVRLLFTDATLPEPFQAVLELSATAEGLGGSERAARLDFQAYSAGYLDLLKVRGSFESGIAELDADLEVLLGRLRLAALTEYLSFIGLAPDAEVLSGDLTLSLRATPVDESRKEARVALDFSRVGLFADAQRVAGLDEVHVEADAFSWSGMRGLRGRITGPTATFRLLESGGLAVAGVRIGGGSGAAAVLAEKLDQAAHEKEAAAAEEAAAVEAPAVASVPAEPSAPISPPFLSRIDLVALDGGSLVLVDEHQQPPVRLELLVDAASLKGLGITAETAAEPTHLEVRLKSPGVLESLELKGDGHPFASSGSGSVEVVGERLTLERVEPYLRAIGLEWTAADASLAGRLELAHERTASGGVRSTMRLADVGLTSGEESLFAIGEIAVVDLEFEPGRSLTVGEVRVAGTRARLRRDAEKRVSFLGLRTLLVEGESVPPPEEPAEATPVAAAVPEQRSPDPAEAPKLEDFIPRLALGRFGIEDTELRITDDALEHPFDLRLTDLGLELTGFELDAAAKAPSTAHLSARFASPGIVKKMSLEGEVTPREGPLGVSVALDCAVQELVRGPLAPYLEDAGLTLIEGASNLGVKVAADASLEPGGLRLEGSLEELLVEQAGVEWVRVDRLACDQVTIGPGGIDIGTVELGKSRLALAREADGSLRFGMLALPPAVAAKGDAAPAAPAKQENQGAGATKVHRAKPPGQLITEALAPLTAFDPPLSLARLKVGEASLSWKDAVPDPPLEATVAVGGELSGVALGKPSDPAKYGFDVRLVESDTHLELKGEIGLLPEDLRLAGEVRVEGLRDGPLFRYLPPPQRLLLENGHGGFDYEVKLESGENDVRSTRVEARNIELRDGDAEEALLACQRMTASVPHIDLPGAEVRFEELAVEGFELTVARGADGKSVELLGFQLAPAPAPVEAPPEEGPAPYFLQLTTRELPQLRLAKLELELARLTLSDRSQPDAPPVEISGLLSAPRDQLLLGPDPDALEPIEFQLELSGEKLFERTKVEVSVSPFSSEPELDAKFSLEGLDGERLLAALPRLAEHLDGRELKNGTAAAELHLNLQFLRRGPFDFDLSNGFGGELSVTGIELRDAPGGELLGGIDSIYADVQQVRPKSGAVNVRSVEIDGIYGRVVEDEEGFHALGLILKSPAAGAPGPAEPPPAAVAPTEASARVQEPAAEQPAAEEPGGPLDELTPPPDIRVDQFLVSGLDFEARSTNVTPPMILPISDLEVDVKRFSLRGFAEGIPMQLRVRVSGGEVELPVRTEGSAFLGGIVGGVTSVVSGGSGKGPVLEPRPVFDEIAVDGSFLLGEHPTGDLRLRVRDLELTTFSSQASKRGVSLGDGVLDTDVKAKLGADEKLKVDSTTTMRHLSLRESADGPISSFLKLPFPLDTTLNLLKNDEGSQVIDLEFDVDSSHGVSAGQIAAQATAALATLTLNAAASAPGRLGKGVLDFTGIGGLTGMTDAEEPPKILGEPMALAFEPGGVVPSRSDFEAVASHVEEARDDLRVVFLLAHQLGQADVERMERLANPDPELCAEIGERLRQRRAELVHERRELSFRMHALWAVGRGAEAEARREDLLALDRELGRIEEAMDVAYDHLRPGAERRRDRRTRHAANSLAVERMHAVRQLLLERFGSDLTGRVELRNPRFHDQTGEEGGRVRVIARRSGEAKQKGLLSRLFGWLPFID